MSCRSRQAVTKRGGDERQGESYTHTTYAYHGGSHALLVGRHGTAKSALFFGFLASFPDAKKFQTLVTRFGTEDAYFGPVKLSALKMMPERIVQELLRIRKELKSNGVVVSDRRWIALTRALRAVDPSQHAGHGAEPVIGQRRDDLAKSGR